MIKVCKTEFRCLSCIILFLKIIIIQNKLKIHTFEKVLKNQDISYESLINDKHYRDFGHIIKNFDDLLVNFLGLFFC